ncbi:hypothetical protein A9976_26320 [Delftia sp. UME58]|nr:hypothetical protein [Delftia sp. UME58]
MAKRRCIHLLGSQTVEIRHGFEFTPCRAFRVDCRSLGPYLATATRAIRTQLNKGWQAQTLLS